MKEKGMERFYQTERVIGKPLFKLFFNPEIINAKKFIPDKSQGPVIFCGNHLHVWDQVPVMCSTDRWIRWFAKKEYFDSSLGWFYKDSGCICVDREGDSQQSAIIGREHLAKGGTLGIFPEGTRNKYQVGKFELEKLNFKRRELERKYREGNLDKETYVHLCLEIDRAEVTVYTEMNKFIENYQRKNPKLKVDTEETLLPFHYGAVSMAKDADALLIPFAVTGEYKLGSKDLMLRYGEPFRPEHMSVQEGTEELRGRVLTLVQENIRSTSSRKQ